VRLLAKVLNHLLSVLLGEPSGMGVSGMGFISETFKLSVAVPETLSMGGTASESRYWSLDESALYSFLVVRSVESVRNVESNPLRCLLKIKGII
jgi:hypothetical protein